MAAALLTLRSEGRVVAHSAGSTAGAAVDTGVLEVMGELGVDLSEAYAKPLAREVIDAADLVVTMGRSVGQIQLPPNASRGLAGGRPDRCSVTRCGACARTSTVACRRSSQCWNRRPLTAVTIDDLASTRANTEVIG